MWIYRVSFSFETYRFQRPYRQFPSSVPLDYFNSSAGTATIALGKYKAPNGPSKGAVFLGAGTFCLHFAQEILLVYL